MQRRLLSWLMAACTLCSPLAADYDTSYDECAASYAPAFLPLEFDSNATQGWEVEAHFLAWRPYASNLSYMVEANPLPLASPSWYIRTIKPRYHFGFDIAVGFVMPCSNMKAKLGWTRFRSHDHAHHSASHNDMLGPFFEIGPDALAFTEAHGRVDFKYDAVDWNYGVFQRCDPDLHTYYFIGVGSVCLKQTRHTRYNNYDGTISRKITVPSSYWGVGPQIGCDVAYDIYQGLQIAGKGVATLLVGAAHNHTTYKTASPVLAQLNIEIPNKQFTHAHRHTHVVPAFASKLGLAYAWSSCRWACDFECGYEVRYYLNAIQSFDIGSEVVTPPVLPSVVGVFARTFQHNKSDFALTGPYFALNFRF